MPDTERKELVNYPPRSSFPIGGWKGILFGAVFVIAGTFVMLIGSWIAVAAGFVFLAPGMLIVFHSIRGMLRRAQHDRHLARDPVRPWLADHPWDSTGASDRGISGLGQMILLGGIVTAFTAILVGLLRSNPPFTFALWVGLVLLVPFGLWGWWQAAYTVLRGLKYGPSRLRFGRFPFFLGEAVDLKLSMPGSVGEYESMTVTLRCVEEVWVTTGSGRQRSSRVVCYQVYGDEKRFDKRGQVSLYAKDMPLSFPLPADGEPNRLWADPPVYWELEVRAKTSGVDYQAIFLLPVYAKPEGVV